jgi:hypothetical protein
MTRVTLILLMLLATCLPGCRRRSSTKDSSTPLTVEQWQVLPAQEKYAPNVMARLKQGNPKFQNDTEWDEFAQNVFLPARQMELPGGLR